MAIFCQKLSKNRENALLEKILKHLQNFMLIVLLYNIVSIQIDKNKEEKWFYFL